MGKVHIPEVLPADKTDGRRQTAVGRASREEVAAAAVAKQSAWAAFRAGEAPERVAELDKLAGEMPGAKAMQAGALASIGLVLEIFSDPKPKKRRKQLGRKKRAAL